MSRLPVAAGLLLGVLADELFADPPSAHPVAAFGSFASAVEQKLYADSRLNGAAFTTVCVLPLTMAAAITERRLRRRPVVRTVVIAAATWTVIGGASLRNIASRLGQHLNDSEPEKAQTLVPSLCGRDPDQLDAAGMVRATVESLAENTSDSVVAPLFWGAVAGLPGLLGYRAVNTLDAMVGHRSPRYARFGTAAARLDDLLNLAPARLSALLTLAGARTVHGSARGGLSAWRADASRHPSPNAGHCEAAMAGVLRVRLGGRTAYRDRVEDRPTLGFGREPDSQDIGNAVRLSHVVQSAAVAILSAGLVLTRARR
jgi:adenosylcobinamide-phosphate synthase